MHFVLEKEKNIQSGKKWRLEKVLDRKKLSSCHFDARPRTRSEMGPHGKRYYHVFAHQIYVFFP